MQEVRDHFRTICGDVHVVRGLSDEGDYPEETVLTVGGVRVGLLHGHQCLPWGDVDALGAVQRRLGCEILVSGHTHRQRVYKYENRLLVDPGSATGAFTPGEAASTPSFCLMEVGGEPRGRVVVYCYRLEDGEVKVERIEHTLDLGDAGAVPPVSLGGEVGVGQAGDGAEAVAKAEAEAAAKAEAEAAAKAAAEAAAKAEAETAAIREVETEDPEPEPKSEPEPAGAVPEATDPFAPFAVSPSGPAAASAGPNLLGDLGDPFVQVAQTPPGASAMQDPFAAPEPVSGGGPHEAEPCADPFAASPNLS